MGGGRIEDVIDRSGRWPIRYGLPVGLASRPSPVIREPDREQKAGTWTVVACRAVAAS